MNVFSDSNTHIGQNLKFSNIIPLLFIRLVCETERRAPKKLTPKVNCLQVDSVIAGQSGKSTVSGIIESYCIDSIVIIFSVFLRNGCINP